jgi:hypothetical protein
VFYKVLARQPHRLSKHASAMIRVQILLISSHDHLIVDYIKCYEGDISTNKVKDLIPIVGLRSDLLTLLFMLNSFELALDDLIKDVPGI